MAREIEKESYKVIISEDNAEVIISEEVIAVIAGIAATDIEGVASLTGNMTRETIQKAGLKNLSKGIGLQMNEDNLTITISLNIKYGYSVSKISEMVQEKVKTSVENILGLAVTGVNIRVTGVIL